MYLIPKLKHEFERNDLRFHVDPYAPTEFYPYQFSDEEKAFLSPFIGADRDNFLDKTMDGHRLCSGGRTHLNIQPDGMAYRCIHDKVNILQPVGNIFDESFRLNDNDTVCNDWANCSGCDRDKVKISRP
jgi:MoaA/NifB/PqqE/SkfB family radical SAM enzyme